MKLSFKIKDMVLLLINIILTEGIAILISLSISDINKTYNILKKPFFSPPNYVFMIVWPVLYLLISIASHRIILKNNLDSRVRKAAILYFTQLIINYLWTIIFFQFKLYGIAFIILIFLVILVFLTIIIFWGIDKRAAILMIPYLLWISYAATLSLSIWLLNEA